MTEATDEPPRSLPPGQRNAQRLTVLHYGPVPKYRPETWRLTVTGATADGREHHLDAEQFASLSRAEVVADLHCVTGWSALVNAWAGVPVSTLLDLIPPGRDVTHVMAWAEYGYSANMRLADFASDRALLATHRDGQPLPPEHGFPLRLIVPDLYAWKGPKWLRAIEYLTVDRRGFWEERGYHAVGNPWREERYSYQE